MSNNPLVTVIIPVYNHENFVQTAIKSIINQTYQNIQLIVIDDGSKDFSYQKVLELKKECEKRFPKTYFETKENMFQKIMIKLKRKVKKNKTALLQSKFEKYSENQYGKYKETKTFKPY